MAGTNIYGELVRAQLFNSASDLTGPVSGLIYFNTTTGAKWYNGSAWKTAGDLESAQTFTGVKTLTSALLAGGSLDISAAGNFSFLASAGANTITIGGATSILSFPGSLSAPKTSNYFDFAEVAAPSTPASGFLRVYAKSDNKLYKKDDNGVETEVGGSSGSGSGEVNAILNSSAATDTTGWTAATNYTIARDTSNSPLSPVTSTSFSMLTTTASAESSTSGIYYSITTMPTGLRNKKLKLEFYCTVPATADGVWRLSVYAGSTRMALSTDSSSVTTLPGGFTGKFTAYFDTDSSTAYTVNFTQTTRTNANTLYVTNVIAGPGIQPQGAVVGEWVAYTPTLGNVTEGSGPAKQFRYRRVGDTMQIFGNLILGGSGDVTGNLSVPLPTGHTIDTAKVFAESASNSAFGQVYALDDSTGTIYEGIAYYGSSSSIIFYDATGSKTQWAAAVPFDWTASDQLTVLITDIPIAEWAGSGVVNLAQNDVEYVFNTSGITTAGASDTTAFGYGPAGAAIGNIASTTANSSTTFRVRFQTPIQVTDSIVVETDLGSSGTQWFEVGNTRDISDMLFQSNSKYGIGMVQVNSTDVDIEFGNKGRISNNATYAGDGGTWSGINTYRWRARKSKSGSPVGFSAATPNSLGLKKVGHGNIVATDADYTVSDLDTDSILFTGFTTTRTVTLPTANIPVGYQLRLENSAAFDMIVNASGGSALTVANGANLDATVRNGFVIVRALQASPTTPAHWRVVNVKEQYTHTTTWTGTGSGGTSASATIILHREDARVVADVGYFGATTNTTDRFNSDTDLVTRFRTNTAKDCIAIVNNNGSYTEAGMVTINTNGNIEVFKDGLRNNFANGTGGLSTTSGNRTCLTWTTN